VLATMARASEADFDLDSKFRAKLAKEKIKQGALERKNNELIGNAGKEGKEATCGSQNIGNVDGSAKPGTAPREIFVFAPNAINFVSGRGCK
jgi:hypothetical protein